MRSTCGKCGGPRTGANPFWCKACFAQYARERRAADPDFAESTRAINRDYKRRNRERASERERLRKAGLAGIRNRVHPLVVLERDDGVCGICGKDVDPLDFHVDHIVPLSRGGEHTYENVQPAHPLCNQRKYNLMEVAA